MAQKFDKKDLIFVSGISLLASLCGLILYSIGNITAAAKLKHEDDPSSKDKEKKFVRLQNAMTTMQLLLIPGVVSTATYWGTPSNKTRNVAIAVASLGSMIAIIIVMALREKKLQAEVDDR